MLTLFAISSSREELFSNTNTQVRSIPWACLLFATLGWLEIPVVAGFDAAASLTVTLVWTLTYNRL